MSEESSFEAGRIHAEREVAIKILKSGIATMEDAAHAYLRRHNLGESLGDLPEPIHDMYAKVSLKISSLADRMMKNLDLVPSAGELEDLFRNHHELLNLLHAGNEQRPLN